MWSPASIKNLFIWWKAEDGQFFDIVRLKDRNVAGYRFRDQRLSQALLWSLAPQ
ncbi:hypothetical protein O9992_17430 [Vibrio lentus]|nr:hypothetical protein [Vibrio lentus]